MALLSTSVYEQGSFVCRYEVLQNFVLVPTSSSSPTLRVGFVVILSAVQDLLRSAAANILQRIQESELMERMREIVPLHETHNGYGGGPARKVTGTMTCRVCERAVTNATLHRADRQESVTQQMQQRHGPAQRSRHYSRMSTLRNTRTCTTISPAGAMTVGLVPLAGAQAACANHQPARRGSNAKGGETQPDETRP